MTQELREPLTDEELDALEGLHECRAMHTYCGPEDPGEGPEPDYDALRNDHVRLGTELVPRLVAEVRRLRELARDAEEGLRSVLAITSRPPDISGGRMYDRGQEVLAALIKDRDGKP